MQPKQTQQTTNSSDTTTPSTDRSRQPDGDPFDTSQITGRARKIRITLLAGLLTATVAVAAYVLLNKPTPPTLSTPTSTESQQRAVELGAAISLTDGTVQLSDDENTWVDARGGETIAQGMSVRTGADSRTVLLLDDGSAVRLDANTTIALTVSDSSLVEVTLIAGQVYSRVIENGSRTFAVVTANERFEAQGTAFKTKSNTDGDQLDVYHSSVKVDSSDTIVSSGNYYDTTDKKIVDIDLNELASDPFIQWNKLQDTENDTFKTQLGLLEKDPPKEAPVKEENIWEQDPASTDKITLSVQPTKTGIKASWDAGSAQIKAPDGFKLVRDEFTDTPSYGDHTSIYISSGDQRSYELKLTDGKEYNFRVCIYRVSDSSCSSYSNTATATAPFEEIAEVVSGALELAIDQDALEWEFAGTAPHGFKVVLSEDTTEPTYPANSIQYVGADTTATELPDKPQGTYYVRVCKYTASADIDGGCTDYSNSVEYVVD